MSEFFKKGDVVQLKSGGPLMTISNYTQNDKVFCQWFNGKEPKGEVFNQEMLTLTYNDVISPMAF